MANEKRLIDAYERMEWLNEITAEEDWIVSQYSADWIYSMLESAYTVDAVEVVHGRWLYDSGSGKYFCSACDEYALSFKKDTLFGEDLYEVCLTDYCPNCGADMRDGDGNG